MALAVPVDVADSIAYLILFVDQGFFLFSLPYAMRICLARVHKLMGPFCFIIFFIKKVNKMGH